MSERYLKIMLFTTVIMLLLGGCSDKKEKIGMAIISIRCDTAVANEMHKEEQWKGIIPEDGCVLDETEVSIYEGDTVFDLLVTARDEYGIHMEYSGGNSAEYIEGINNLYERDGGRWSGWMYSVNGEYPDIGCGQYELKDGDIVEWNYSCDLGLDLEGAAMDGAEEWKDAH